MGKSSISMDDDPDSGQAQQHLTDAHQKKEVSLRVGRLRMRGFRGGSRFPDRWGERTKELRIEFLVLIL